MYLLKLAFRPWRLAPLSQIFSGLAVGFLLLLVGFLFWMQQGLKSVIVRLQGEQVVTAYVAITFPPSDESRMVESIRNALASQGVLDIQMVSAPQFIQALKKQYPDLGRELEDLGQEMLQIVPRYVSISGVLTDSALEKVKSLPGIENVESSKDRYRHVVGAISAIRWVARILMGGIAFALLTGLIHLSRMNAYLHKDALSLLKFWGAGHGILAGPGMISGCFVGLLGGVIASGGWMTVGTWCVHHVRSLSLILHGMPPVNSSLAISLFILGGLVGVFAGILASIGGLSSESQKEGGFAS